MPSRSPRTGWPYLDEAGGFLAFAHRGGATAPGNEGRENTREAFAHAVALGYRYLETDVHLTADGQLVAFHDPLLERVSDGTGSISALSREQLSRLKVGREPIPTLVELLEAFPDARFNIDLKGRGTERALAELVLDRGLEDRVLVGCFEHLRIDRFRRLTGGRVATAATPLEAAAYRTMPGGVARRLVHRSVAALQVPARRGPVEVVTASFVARAHAQRLHVHVWTVDDAPEIERLLDRGVDGVFSDRTDILRDVLRRRGEWDVTP